VHDIFGVTVFLFLFSAVVFFAPEFGGYFLEYNNFIPADPLKTPNHIARSGTSRPSIRCCVPSPAR
jgi:ubiquinol-cytochrome c reductase cytochrome b subunit